MSFLMVLSSAFIVIQGAEECKMRAKEEETCISKCGLRCGAYFRPQGDALGEYDAYGLPDCLNGQKRENCLAIESYLGLQNQNDCDEEDTKFVNDVHHWVDELWAEASDDEKRSGNLRPSAKRKVVENRMWRIFKHRCRILIPLPFVKDPKHQKAYDEAAIRKLNAKPCGDQLRPDIEFTVEHTGAPWRHRNYLFVAGSPPDKRKIAAKWCGIPSPAVINAFQEKVYRAFKTKAEEEKEGAEFLRKQGGGRAARREHILHPRPNGQGIIGAHTNYNDMLDQFPAPRDDSDERNVWMALFTSFALFGLCLCVCGVFVVVSFWIGIEIGKRMKRERQNDDNFCIAL